MKIYYIIITILLSTKLLAETNPPKVTTQQFQNWTYQCVEDEKKKICEVSQNIRIQNSNINFTDNSKDEKMINLYKKIYDSLNKSQSLEIAVKALVGNQPIAVQSNLNGFNAAAKKLDSEKSS
jgi:invasion protein IalB